MAVNLELVIDRYGQEPMLGSPVLRLDLVDYDLWDRLAAEAVPLEGGAYLYGDDGLTLRTETAYGKPLAWLTAHALVRLLAGIELSRWDTAAVAYLRLIPPGTRVVLNWR